MPDDLQQFIRHCISSLWTVEALLLLHRSPQRRWLSCELDRELRASPGVVAAVIRELGQHGLITRDDSGRYGYQAAPDKDRQVRDLAHAYAERPISVIALVADPNRTIQAFADAFLLRPT